MSQDWQTEFQDVRRAVILVDDHEQSAAKDLVFYYTITFTWRDWKILQKIIGTKRYLPKTEFRTEYLPNILKITFLPLILNVRNTNLSLETGFPDTFFVDVPVRLDNCRKSVSNQGTINFFHLLSTLLFAGHSIICSYI